MISILKNISLALIVTLNLAACSGPFSDYSNYELREAFDKCDFNKLNAAGAQRCNNIIEECEKRKEDTGFRC